MLRNVHCGGGEGVAMGNGMEQVKLAAVKIPAIISAIVPEYIFKYMHIINIS
eukprot:COSAG06_NODE_295_length_18175_cov_9.088017_11_plen_52_part_00